MRSASTLHAQDNDFVQARNLYRDVMPQTDREHLVTNIVGHMSQGVERFIQEPTVTTYWYQVDADLGVRVARGLGLEIASDCLLPVCETHSQRMHLWLASKYSTVCEECRSLYWWCELSPKSEASSLAVSGNQLGDLLPCQPKRRKEKR
jgi:hypothetical protein